MTTATVPAPQDTTKVQHEPSKSGSPISVNLLEDVYVDEELNNRELVATDEEIIELAASIESTNGLLQPIGVYGTPPERRTEHGKPYELGYGYRRRLALMYLAERDGDNHWVTDVPAMLKEHATISQRHIDQLIENLGRKNLSPMETALAFKKALDDPHADLTQTDLARKIGWDTSTVSNYLKVTRLCPEVQALVLHGKLLWSNARELASLDLPVETQKLAAEIGTAKSVEEFGSYLKSTYGKSDSATDEAPATTSGEPTPGQKTPQAVRATVLKDKYLPKLAEDLKAVEGKTDQESKRKVFELKVRMDTLKFVLQQEGTQLSVELQPWEAELQKKAEEEKEKAEETSHRKKFVSTAISAIDKILKEAPPVTAANRAMKTLPQALEMMRATIQKELDDAVKDGWDAGMMISGFPLAEPGNFQTDEQKKKVVDTFLAEIDAGYKEHLAAMAKRSADREAKKKAKELEEAKLKKEAEGQQGTNGSATTESKKPEPAAAGV